MMISMQTKQAPIRAAEIEFVPENYFQPLDLESVFRRSAPLEVDLGCGDGSFLAALAKQNPTHDFLGLERLRGRIRSACHKIARQKLDNARVLRVESSYAVAYLIPPDSISAFYLLFPDPWPKRRHQSRRLVNTEFLEAIARALVHNGFFVVATDDHAYFSEIQRLVDGTKKFVLETPNEFSLPPTTFERHFRERGLEIHRLVLRKTSPVK
jgi:tRNA (guanine-N7-)-methyltransferase